MHFDCLELESIVGFDWDDGNIHKNEKKYGLKWMMRYDRRLPRMRESRGLL